MISLWFSATRKVCCKNALACSKSKRSCTARKAIDGSFHILLPNLHDWNAFIKPGELLALMKRYGLDHREITGLKPGTNPITTTILLRKRKRGKISLFEMGTLMSFQQTRDTSILYMGYALKAGHA